MRESINLSILRLVGVSVDKSYPWLSTFIANSDVAEKDHSAFNQCHRFITVKYRRNVNLSGCRQATEDVWISKDKVVDVRHGAALLFPDANNVIIETSQECNEWFQICLQIMLIREGYSMVHAAAFEKNGAAVVLPSWGGVGKTACAATFVRDYGWSLLGDDIVVVNSQGEVYPFPKNFVIYPYHREIFPKFFKTNDAPKVPLVLHGLFRSALPKVRESLRRFPKLLAIARKKNPHSKRVRPSVLFPEENQSVVGSKGQAKITLWIERTVGDAPCVEEQQTDKLASKIASVTLHELADERLLNLMAVVGSGHLEYRECFTAIRDIVASAIDKSRKMELEIPADESISNVPELVARIVFEEIGETDGFGIASY